MAIILHMVQMREFHEGESIKVREKDQIIPDLRRFPKYIVGKVGTVRKVIGYVHCPPDHEKKPPYHSCIFSLNFSRSSVVSIALMSTPMILTP